MVVLNTAGCKADIFCFVCMLAWCCSYNKAMHQTYHKKQDKVQEQRPRERGNQEIKGGAFKNGKKIRQRYMEKETTKKVKKIKENGHKLKELKKQ